MTTDPGDSLFNGTSQCPSELFKDPKPTFLMKNLQEIFIQFSKAIEARNSLQGDFRSRFPKSYFNSAKSLGGSYEALMWKLRSRCKSHVRIDHPQDLGED